MQKYQDTVLDKHGRPVSGASVTVTTSAGAPTTIYSDNGATVLVGLTTGADGSYAFYAADGRYNIQITRSGYAGRTITDVLLEDPAETASNRIIVIGCTGQSNAAGANSGGPNPASARVKTWDGATGAWGGSDYTKVPWTRANPDGNVGNNNVALALAHRIADETGARVFIIFDAVGGQSIDRWVETGVTSVRYAGFRAKVAAALASPELVGITKLDYLVWAQGEEDALTMDVATYRDRFTTLDTQFRAETWMDKITPMLVMGMSGLHTRYQVWQAQLDYCANVNRSCIYVNSMGLKTQFDATGAGDFTHWLGDSLWEHGYHRAWYALNERGLTHRQNLVPFYSRGSGPWRGEPDAVALFKSLVSIESATGGIGVTDTFTGDGATTAFTLTIVGGTTTSVTVGGVAKATPADYSVVGQTLTFTAAPANLAAIVVTYSQTINGPAASGSISWGFRCYADGNYTYSFGYQNVTDNLCNYTALVGRENTADANGDFSFASGFQQALKANYCFAAGRGHILIDPGTAAVGMFSKYTTTQTDAVVWQVGVGSSSGARANAHTVRASGITEHKTQTVAALPAAGTAGRRGFVTDANAATFGTVVAAGGANKVPVFDNGTNWVIG